MHKLRVRAGSPGVAALTCQRGLVAAITLCERSRASSCPTSYGLVPAIALCEKSRVVVRHELEMLFASSERNDRIGLNRSAWSGLHDSRILGRHTAVAFSSPLNAVVPKDRAVRALLGNVSSEPRLDSQPPMASERCKTSGGAVLLHDVAPTLEKSDEGRS